MVVYFVKGAGKEVKIGVANNLDRRIPSLRTDILNLEVVFYIEDDNARELERHFHQLFDDKHVSGEWYLLSDEDLDMIRVAYETKIYDKNISLPVRRNALRESKVYAVNLEIETAEILQIYCEENGISLSALARKIFKEFINQNKLE